MENGRGATARFCRLFEGRVTGRKFRSPDCLNRVFCEPSKSRSSFVMNNIPSYAPCAFPPSVSSCFAMSCEALPDNGRLSGNSALLRLECDIYTTYPLIHEGKNRDITRTDAPFAQALEARHRASRALCAVAAAAVSWALLPNTYTASVSMYVLTKSSSDSSNINQLRPLGEPDAHQRCRQLAKSDRVLADTAKALKMENLSDYEISVESATTTRCADGFGDGRVGADGRHRGERACGDRGLGLPEVMDVKSVNVIDQAAEPSSPSGPPRAMYTAVAFSRRVVSCRRHRGGARHREHARANAEEVEELLGVPVIGRIPGIKS